MVGSRSKRDLLFRSIDDDEDDDKSVARSTATRDSRKGPVLLSQFFSREFSRAICKGRARILGGVVPHVVAVIGDAVEPRPQRYRSAVRHGSTANRQRPRALPLPLGRLFAFRCGSLDGAHPRASFRRRGSLQVSNPPELMPLRPLDNNRGSW